MLLISVAAGIVILVVAVVILVKVMVTSERVRESVLPLAEKRLNRKIDYKNIAIGIFPRIYVSDLKILNRHDTSEFVSVEKVVLHYQFLSLLQGRVELSKIVLEQPDIHIIRFFDGTFNFSDLTSASTSDAAGSDVGKPYARRRMAFLVAELKIMDGQLHFLDQAVSGQTPCSCTLNQFNLKSSDITLEDAFPFEMSATINGAPFTLSGTWNIKAAQGDVKLGLESLDVAFFSPYVAKSFPSTLKSAKLSLNLDVSTNNSLTFGGQGTAQLASPTLIVDLAIVLDAINLQDLIKQAPQALARNYQDYQLRGRVSADLKIAGEVDQGFGLLKTANLALDNIEATVGSAVAKVDGRVTYAKNRLKTDGVDFKYAVEGGTLTLDMTYHTQAPSFRGNFGLTAKRINLNALMNNSKKSASSGKTVASAEKMATEPGPFAIPADVRGLITVDEILYKKLSIQHTRAELSLKNSHLVVENLSAQIAGGGLEGTADVNLGVAGLAYQGKFNLSESDTKELISSALPDINGKAMASASFSGKGTLSENLIPALQVSGNAKFLDGFMKETKVQQALSLFLGFSEFKVLTVQSLNIDMDMKNSLINLNSALDSSTLQVTAKGTVSAEKDHALDLILELRIAPDILKKMKGGDFAKYIADDKGWGRIVLNLRGTPKEPKIGLDPEALKETAKQMIKEKVTNKIAKITEKLSEKLGTSKTEETKVSSTFEKEPKIGLDSDELKETAKQMIKEKVTDKIAKITEKLSEKLGTSKTEETKVSSTFEKEPKIGLDSDELKEIATQMIKEKVTDKIAKITEKLSEKLGTSKTEETKVSSTFESDTLKNILKDVRKKL